VLGPGFLLSPPGWAWRWLGARRAGLRPWGSFLDQRRFGVPRDLGELWRRLGQNAERFQSNYLLLFLALLLYCLLSSPLLLVALGVFFGVAVRLRAREAPLVLLGAALVFLGSHAAFRELEPPESAELQMEPV
uniref:PRA1 family protein n=1 Tax=Taeniopygia guttata TaxID=59729 RepID=A0A674H3V7_TAEGU